MWYALAIIILLVIIILSLNIKLSISYTKEKKHIITICILFLKITLYPQKKKKKKSKKNASIYAEENNDDKNSVVDKKPKVEQVEKESKKFEITFSKILKMLSFIRYRLTIYDIRITMNVGIDDAANTAILCGAIYAKIYAAIGLLQSAVIVSPPFVQINPLYNEIKLEAEYFISVKIRIFRAIIILFKTYHLLKERKI